MLERGEKCGNSRLKTMIRVGLSGTLLTRKRLQYMKERSMYARQTPGFTVWIVRREVSCGNKKSMDSLIRS